MTDAQRDSADRAREREREELVGRTVGGKYAIVRLIGRGGMGAVYEGENLAIGRKVALKFVDVEWAKDEIVASRFAREARAATCIESEHIVNVLDAGSEGGRPYLVMELLRGEDLGTRLRRERRIPVAEALHIVAQVLRGLAQAHDQGIVHRDLKPDNVFLIERGEDANFVKIVDFGISKIDRPKSGTAPLALTQRGIVLGTPFYMSPEQAQAFADVDSRADLYSVGAILFESLAGRPPHTGETYEQVIVSICMRDAPDLRAIDPQIPDAVAAFVTRSLARDREKRFASAADMLAALRGVAPDEPAARPMLGVSAPRARLQSDASGGGGAPSERAMAVSGVVAGPPTHVSWSAAHSPSADVAQRRKTRSRRSVLATAGAALLAGIGTTMLLMFLGRGHESPQIPDRAGSTSTASPTGSDKRAALSAAVSAAAAAPIDCAPLAVPPAPGANTTAQRADPSKAPGGGAGAAPTPTKTAGPPTSPPATAPAPVPTPAPGHKDDPLFNRNLPP